MMLTPEGRRLAEKLVKYGSMEARIALNGYGCGFQQLQVDDAIKSFNNAAACPIWLIEEDR